MRTFNDVALEFLDARRAERYSEGTIKSYYSILDAFAIYIQGQTVTFTDIQPSDIRAYLGSLDEVADKTVYNHHVCLSSLWTWSIEQGYCVDHVIRAVKPPKFTNHRVVPFTEVQCRRILTSCKRSRDRALVMVLLDCGLRAAELCGLTVEDWSPGLLKVMGKGRKERLVPISPPTETAIQNQLVARRVRSSGIDGGDALFACVISGKRMSYTTVQTIMRRLEKYSGIANIHCHRFRHTFAITYLRNGGDIYTLQRILGHSSLDTVKIYLDIVHADVQAAHRSASPIVNWNLEN